MVFNTNKPVYRQFLYIWFLIQISQFIDNFYIKYKPFENQFKINVNDKVYAYFDKHNFDLQNLCYKK